MRDVIDSLSIAESVLPDLIKLAQVKQKLAGFWYQVTYSPAIVLTDEITKPGYLASVSDGPDRFTGSVMPTEAGALLSAFERWQEAQ